MEESASGLYVNASVKFRGVEVGRVNALDLRTDEPRQVRITLAIESGVPIAVDKVATLAFQGLTGIASVDLYGGHADSPLLQPKPGEAHPILQTGPELFTRFDPVVSELIANLNLVAKDAHELMKAKNPDSAEKILADGYKASVSRDENAAAVGEMNNLMAVFLPELAQFCVDSSQGGSNRSD